MKQLITLMMLLFISMIYGQESRYASIDFIKPIQGENYGEILSEKWAKLAQKRIDQGTIDGWDAWWVADSTSESEYQIVLVTLAKEIDSLNSGTGLRSVFPEMSDEELQAFNKKNQAARKIIKTNLVTIKDNIFKVDSLPNMVVMNYMKVKSQNAFAYEKMEEEFKKQYFEASPKQGWGLAKRVDKIGSYLGWNYVTFDFYNSISELMLERVPTVEYPEDLQDKINIREHGYSETLWKWISLRKSE